jgi:arylsulfatase A
MPLDKGFDHFWGIPASMNYGVLAWFEGRYPMTPPTLYTRKKPNQIALSDYRIRPPYDTEPRYRRVDEQTHLAANELEVAPDFVDSECLTRFTDEAIRWLEANASSDEETPPFFLYLPYTSPHKPVIPLPQFQGQSAAGAYGDFMVETDWHIGRVLETLQRLGVDRQTLLIVTSDNGPETTWRERAKRFQHHSNGRYREGKRSIYEGGHRVPFLVRWPERIEAGRVCDTPICQTDLLATLAGILEVPLSDNAGEDSADLSELWLAQGDAIEATEQRVAEARPPLVHHSINGRFAIRHGRWKLVMEQQKPSASRELYDLEEDPSETTNCLADHPEIAERLADQLREIVRRGRSTAGSPQANDTGWWNHLVWMEPW